jgi:hypothetical protein
MPARKIEEIATNTTEALKNGDNFDDMRSFVRKSDWDEPVKRAWLAALDEGKRFKVSKPDGSMYEVNINANPDDFLDWDKPLSEQGEKVRSAFKELNHYSPSSDKLPTETIPGTGIEPTGASMHQWLANRVKSQPADYHGNWADFLDKSAAGQYASQEMRDAGIPGIKYLDAGSRSAGDGSRNYVVFDDKLIEIVKKYGLAATLGAGLITQEMANQMQAQGLGT